MARTKWSEKKMRGEIKKKSEAVSPTPGQFFIYRMVIP